MRKTIDLESFLPGADWQRLETWAAIAGMSPLVYLRVCVHRGHAVLCEEIKADAPATSPFFTKLCKVESNLVFAAS